MPENRLRCTAWAAGLPRASPGADRGAARYLGEAERFAALMAEMEAAGRALAQAADEDAVWPAAERAAETCKACHQLYRKPYQPRAQPSAGSDAPSITPSRSQIICEPPIGVTGACISWPLAARSARTASA